MYIKLLLLLLTFFATVPNLGFFTFPSFLITTFIIFVLLALLFNEKSYNILTKKIDDRILQIFFFIILFFSGIYYGGLYQNAYSIIIGNFIFFGLIFYIFISQYIFKATKKLQILLIIIFYIFLSIWTIINSPAPIVDTFVLSKEAPMKLLNGENPYFTLYSRVYENVEPNYYGYLPFSIVFMIPFVVLFSDPRFSVIFANLISAFIFYVLFKKKGKYQMVTLFILVFLFLPRSFYMLEHLYLDTIIFSFFLIYLYFLNKGKEKLYFLFLSLFFSFKQNIFLLFPLFLNKKKLSRLFYPKNLLIFILPFILPLYYLIINPQAFIKQTILVFNPSTIIIPIESTLSLSAFLKIVSKDLMWLSIVIGLLLILTTLVILFRKNYSITFKITIVLFLFNYFMFQSFFNHYYLIIQFLLLDIALDYFKLKIDVKSLIS